MIKKLRTKLILVIMAIVMVLLGVILGVVIHFTAENMKTQSISMMRTIAANPFQQDNPGRPSRDEVRLPFFTVQISSRGDLITASGGYFDLTDREYIQEIVNAALLSDRETGELAEHDLRYLKSASPKGFTIVFSDTTTENAMLKHLFYSCLAIFFAAMVAFLGISILLSRWVIKPVETAWNQQRQFVSDASHELKTPLASIKLLTDSILQNDMDMETVREFVGDIGNEADRLTRTTGKLLSLTKVDGRITEECEIITMEPTAQRVVRMLSAIAQQNQITIETDFEQDSPILMLEDDLYQIVFNLVENGIKYNVPGGKLTVRLLRQEDNAILQVSDTGMGIPEDALSHIFERFYRVDKSHSKASGGTGLGLSIVKHAAAYHKAEISLESTPGKGTTITIQF